MESIGQLTIFIKVQIFNFKLPNFFLKILNLGCKN
jgi:hypothetical protein